MCIAGNKQGIEVFNELNHNELGDPHPQYNHFKTYLSNASSGDIARNTLKLFDMDIQFKNNSVETWDIKSQGLLLTFYYLVANTPKRPYEKGVINITIPFDENGNIKAGIDELYNSNEKINFVLGTKLTDSNTLKYNIKLYVRFDNTYSSIRILPLLFDTVLPSTNQYELLHDIRATTAKRLDILFQDIENNNFINNNELINELTGYTTVYSQKEKELTYREGDTILINKDIDTIVLGAYTQQTINKILYQDGTVMDGKTIKVIAYNGRVTIASTGDIQSITSGEIVLKDKNDTVVAQNGIIEFYCYKGLWIEKSRSFSSDLSSHADIANVEDMQKKADNTDQ